MKWNVVTVCVASLLLQFDGFGSGTAGIPFVGGYLEPALHVVFLLSSSIIVTELLREASKHGSKILTIGRPKVTSRASSSVPPASVGRAAPSEVPTTIASDENRGDGTVEGEVERKGGVGRLSEEQASRLA